MLSDAVIRELHALLLLHNVSEISAVTSDGVPTTKQITPGVYREDGAYTLPWRRHHFLVSIRCNLPD